MVGHPALPDGHEDPRLDGHGNARFAVDHGMFAKQEDLAWRTPRRHRYTTAMAPYPTTVGSPVTSPLVA
jgi:hypothetical protein